MVFWKRKNNWEDEYDEYYTRDIERGGDEKAKYRYVAHLLLLIFVGAVFCTIVGTVAGVTMLEKLLTALAMPVGLLWLMLLVTIYFCMMNRQTWPALMCFVCWLFLTVAGNSFFTSWYARTIEQPFLAQDLESIEPIDVLVILGGGTNTRTSGVAQVTQHGDRIVQAAQLWHSGQAKQLMCTGLQVFRNDEKDLHPYEEAAAILEGLGVTPQSILKLNGINTFEEIQNLKKWADANPESRIGLLTSAWHLPRAMRLAAKADVDVVPVAAGFYSQPWAPEPGMVVPSESNLSITTAITREYLAKIVSR